MPSASHNPLRLELDAIYRRFNRPEFIAPDPLEPVLRYADPRDQEVVALVCASLAFGNVKTILASIEVVLRLLPERPRELAQRSETALARGLQGFRHRYVGGPEMARMLCGAATTLRQEGSLAAAFEQDWRSTRGQFESALSLFVLRLRLQSPQCNYLLPDPALGSACKRWMMFLRWMVRKDAVDPGSWRALGCTIAPRQLLMPVDTHVLRAATALGFTARKQGSLLAAREITDCFRALRPNDPTRYDFALTRFGIRRQPELEAMLQRWRRDYGVRA